MLMRNLLLLEEHFLVAYLLVQCLLLNLRFDALNRHIVVDSLLVSLVNKFTLKICDSEFQSYNFILMVIVLFLEFIDELLSDNLSLLGIDDRSFPKFLLQSIDLFLVVQLILSCLLKCFLDCQPLFFFV